MSLKDTRSIIDSIHDGTLENQEFEEVPGFNLQIPKYCPGLSNQSILNPINTWDNKELFTATSKRLAKQFISNFSKYESGTPREVIENGGPDLSKFE